MITEQDTKCVIVINEDLPLGVIANTSAILGVTLGNSVPELVGEEVIDASGKKHVGIVTIPVPILKCNKQTLKQLRRELYTNYYEEMIVVDFSDVAQSSNIYK